MEKGGEIDDWHRGANREREKRAYAIHVIFALWLDPTE